MFVIMKNTWLIFKKNRDFIRSVTIQPVIVFLLMSFIMNYSTDYKIAVINNDSGEMGQRIVDTFKNMEGFEYVDVEEDNIGSELYSGSLELAIIIGENNTELIDNNLGANIQLISLGSSEIEDTAMLIVNQLVEQEKSREEIDYELVIKTNTVKKSWISIANSLGFMIFKIVTSSNLLAALIINERKNKMKDRIFLSGIGANKYLSGMGIAYLLCMMVGSVIYYLAALGFGFDFGMKYTIGFLLMLFAANVLSVCMYLLISTFVNNDGSLWAVQVLILMPMGVLSGALFPFHLMPEGIKTIANMLPFRWVIGGIESMQKNSDIVSGLPYIALILVFSVVLYIVALIRTKQSALKNS